MPPTHPTPFFSVVIPTKNRSFLVGNAIQSGLRQTFTDLEVIVADNDDAHATRTVVESFQDSRLKYVRTGGLNMPDNWEAGVAQARGEYVVVLEDKQALKFSALEQVSEAIQHTRPPTIKWLSDTFSDAILPPRIRLARADNSLQTVPSDAVLDQFAKEPGRHFKQTLPLPQLGCFHRSLAERIRACVLGRLFHPVSPDVIFGFLQLAYADSVLQVNRSLVVYTSSRHSNGKSLATKGSLGRQFTRELGGSDRIYYDRVPVQALTIPGTVFNDYLKIQSIVQGRLAQHPIHWSKYFLECHRAMIAAEREGVDMSAELGAWRTALAQQPVSVRDQVNQVLGSGVPRHLREMGNRWKRWERRVGLVRAQRACKAFYRARIQQDPTWRFSNAMEYLEWEHAHRQVDRVKS